MGSRETDAREIGCVLVLSTPDPINYGEIFDE